MLHIRLGEDPQWALVRERERLELTDPPTCVPPHGRSPVGGVRTVLIAASALAITVLLHADTAPGHPTATPSVAWPGGHAAGVGRADPPSRVAQLGRSAAFGVAHHLRRPASRRAGPASPRPPRAIVHRAVGRNDRMQRTPQ